MASKLKEETSDRKNESLKLSDATSKVEELSSRLKASEEKCEKNEKVIDYLNKQLNARPPQSTNAYAQKAVAAASRHLVGSFDINASNFSSLPKNHSTPINNENGKQTTPPALKGVESEVLNGVDLAAIGLPRPSSALKSSTLTNQR